MLFKDALVVVVVFVLVVGAVVADIGRDAAEIFLRQLLVVVCVWA